MGAAAVSSIAQFVPTVEEAVKVTAFVLKKHAQGVALLEEQRRKEREVAGGGNSGDGGSSAAAVADTSAAAAGDVQQTAAAGGRRKSKSAAAAKLPAVTVDDIDAAALTKLKLGKAEQFVFIFAQVWADLFSARMICACWFAALQRHDSVENFFSFYSYFQKYYVRQFLPVTR